MSKSVEKYIKRRTKSTTGSNKQDQIDHGKMKQSIPKTAYMMAKCAVIGKNIREQRKQRRFTVEELAGHLDLSESYIGLLERGERCPSLKIVYKLCDLYNIPPCDLLMVETTDKEGVDDGTMQNAKMQMNAIVSLAGMLSSDENELIIEIMRKLKKMGK